MGTSSGGQIFGAGATTSSDQALDLTLRIFTLIEPCRRRRAISPRQGRDVCAFPCLAAGRDRYRDGDRDEVASATRFPDLDRSRSGFSTRAARKPRSWAFRSVLKFLSVLARRPQRDRVLDLTIVVCAAMLQVRSPKAAGRKGPPRCGPFDDAIRRSGASVTSCAVRFGYRTGRQGLRSRRRRRDEATTMMTRNPSGSPPAPPRSRRYPPRVSARNPAR